MSQAQIAGGNISSPGQYPTRGYRLRDFTLTSVDGKDVHPSDYRGRSGLVLVFAGGAATASSLLKEIGQRYSQVREEEGQVLAIVQEKREAAVRIAHKLSLPFPVLVDEDGRVHREFGGADAEGRPAPAIYVCDRYGEVFGSYRTSSSHALPRLEEILNWLSFINSQCPECEAPEWPP